MRLCVNTVTGWRCTTLLRNRLLLTCFRVNYVNYTFKNTFFADGLQATASNLQKAASVFVTT